MTKTRDYPVGRLKVGQLLPLIEDLPPDTDIEIVLNLALARYVIQMARDNEGFTQAVFEEDEPFDPSWWSINVVEVVSGDNDFLVLLYPHEPMMV